MTGGATSLQLPGPLLLIGAGKMATALLEGWLRLGVDPKQVFAIDPGPVPEIVEMLAGAGVALNATEVPEPAVILLAVKPQVLGDVVPLLRRHVGPRTLVMSVLAGKSLAALEAVLPQGTPVVRTMPNTPAAVGRGMTALVANAAVSRAQRELADALVSAAGEAAWLEDEAQMDAVTAVSGCGPAYVFLLVEAMAKAGVAAGLAPDLAMQLARSTVTGAGELLHRSDLSAETLRVNVTSKGGVTAEALAVLMAPDGIQPLFDKALARAAERSRELAG
jgi:pyrroline-5-carboxylate reductase